MRLYIRQAQQQRPRAFPIINSNMKNTFFLLITLLFCPFGTEVNAQISTSGVYKITVKSTGNSLDVQGSSTADRATVLGFNYTGSDNQKFYFKKHSDGYYSILMVHSDKALDVSTSVKGSRVYQYKYHGKDNQKFKLIPKGDGYYQIKSKSSGMVLDVIKDQSKLIHWTAHTGPNQLFKIQALAQVDVNSVGTVHFAGNLKFEMIADRVWKESKNGIDVGIFEERKRSKTSIYLADYDRDVNIELNISNNAMEQGGKRIQGITKTEKMASSYRKLYRVHLLGETLFAYYSDNVYGYHDDGNGKRAANVPGCSGPGGGTYKEVFFPACEEHDRYWRAPWKEANFGRNIAKNITNHTFLSRMTKLCDDAANFVANGTCRVGTVFWLSAVHDFGDMTASQEHEEFIDDNRKDDYRVVKYRIPKKRAEALAARRRKIGLEIPYTYGTEYEVTIDFDGAGNNDYSDTKSLITVELFDKYDISLGYECSYGISFGTEKTFSIFTDRTPSYFVISSHGHDAFYMDAVTIENVNTGKKHSHGIDGGSGWCLSTDANDTINAADNDKRVKCFKAIKFNAFSKGSWSSSKGKKWDFPSGIGPLTD